MNLVNKNYPSSQPKICLLIWEREKHQCERGTSTSCLLYTPWLGILSKSKYVPWLGIEPTILLVYGMMLQPTDSPSPGQVVIFLNAIISIYLNTSVFLKKLFLSLLLSDLNMFGFCLWQQTWIPSLQHSAQQQSPILSEVVANTKSLEFTLKSLEVFLLSALKKCVCNWKNLSSSSMLIGKFFT